MIAGVMKAYTFLVSCLACVVVSSSPAAVKEWTGNASGFWSNPNNWNPPGAPAADESLNFSADANSVMINDVPNLSVRELVFERDYILSGNPITLLGSSNNFARIRITEHGGSVTINCALVLANQCIFHCEPLREDGSGKLRINAGVNLSGFDLSLVSFPGGAGASAVIEFAGSISGNGNVTISPSHPDRGKIEFVGSAENAFTGTMRVSSSGSLPDEGVYFNKQSGSVVLYRLELDDGVTVDVQRPHQIGDGATVCVSGGSRLLFHGNTETIGNLCLTNRRSDTVPSLVDTGGSTLSVLGDIIAVNNATNVVPTIRGKLGLPGPVAAAAARSTRNAGFQPVSPTSSRHAPGNSSASGTFEAHAGWKPAIRQTGGLRYASGGVTPPTNQRPPK